MTRLGNIFCASLIGAAAFYIGWHLWIAGQAVRGALFDATIPVRLEFSGRVGGDEPHGKASPRETGNDGALSTGEDADALRFRSSPFLIPLAESSQPPRITGQAQALVDATPSLSWLEGDGSRPSAPVYSGLFIYDLRKPAIAMPEELTTLVPCESNYQADAIGDHGRSRGILQINLIWLPLIHELGFTWDDMLLAEPNVAVAKAILERRGVSEWSCSP